MEAVHSSEMSGQTSSTLRPSFEQHPPWKPENLYWGSFVNGKDKCSWSFGRRFVLTRTLRDKVRGHFEVSVERVAPCFVFGGPGLKSQQEDSFPESLKGRVQIVSQNRPRPLFLHPLQFNIASFTSCCRVSSINTKNVWPVRCCWTFIFIDVNNLSMVESF